MNNFVVFAGVLTGIYVIGSFLLVHFFGPKKPVKENEANASHAKSSPD